MNSEIQMASRKLELKVEFPFSSEKEAQMVCDVLRVDKEPPRSQVSKSLILDKNILHVCFNAPTFHNLRTGVNGFLDSLLLVCETIQSFGPPISGQYTH